ncbi:MAG: hypothetical protein J1F31_02010 [Erysipelotrichales bacterium]|nr:hypothetical protein [Erysipelotrichales bacterium]
MKKILPNIFIMLLALVAVSAPRNVSNVETTKDFTTHVRRAKVTPTFSFTYEKDGEEVALTSGTHFTEGKVPAFNVHANEEGAQVEVYYTMNDGATNLGSVAPSEPGTYAVNVNSIEDDNFESKWDFRWYVIDPAPEEGQIKVHLVPDEVAFIYDGLPHSPIWHFEDESNKKVEGVQYTAKYSSEETGYDSEEAPTDIAWYSISITITDDKHLMDGSWWVVFHIDDSADAFIRDWNALRVEGGSEGMCAFITDGNTYKLMALINRYDKLNENDRARVNEEYENDGETLISTSITYFKSMLGLESHAASDDQNSNSTLLLVEGNVKYVILLVSLLGVAALSYMVITKRRIALLDK